MNTEDAPGPPAGLVELRRLVERLIAVSPETKEV
jgi:hypothetical protein